MRLGKKLLTTGLGVFFQLFFCFSQAEENDFAIERVFEGEAVPSITSILKYGFNDAHRGILDYAARPGTTFKPAEYDAKGNIIREGDVLLHMDPTYKIGTYRKAKADLEAIIASCKDAEQTYIRDEKLIKGHAVSEAVYHTSKMNYIKAKAQVESLKLNLMSAKQLLDLSTFRAPFEGIVDQTLVCAGLMCGEQPAIQISQLVPIGIKVKMDRKIASQITINTPIKIYPLNSNTPVGVFPRGDYYPVGANGKYGKDEIIFTVDNHQLPPPFSLDDNGKKIPVFLNYWPVLDYKNKVAADSNIAVISECIYKDQSEDYVWKLKENKSMQPGRGIDYISPVQKVYIKTGNFSRYEASYVKTITVQPNKDLEAGDILLAGSLPDTLKEGDKVCIYDGRYLFMPGDTVAVVIGPNKNK